MSLSKHKIPIQSTAGAIPMKNDKGELYMEKVKVNRYVSGKRPEYAPDSSDSEGEDIELAIADRKKVTVATLPTTKTDAEKEDRRLRRLQERRRDSSSDEEDRVTRHRRLHEPEVLEESDSEDEPAREPEEESEEEEEELDEEEIERRRTLLRNKAQQQREEEELLDLEDEKGEEESEQESSSEYEEYTDSEEEETGPRLKPVFVRKKDRVTIQEKEKEEIRAKEAQVEAKKMAEERRFQTLKMVEDDVRREKEQAETNIPDWSGVLTDEDNDEEEYEAWKLRELKRIKRDRDERETIEKDRQEIERLRNMTEEERRQESKSNPKVVTNKAQSKGKYKFLQKYYHRGSFFVSDQEDKVYTRDFSEPTLDDHFDKTVLPKVMQVKNFGRSGRTKYTHLVDQDTTIFDSPWIADTAMNLKFHTGKGGGMKQSFDKPTNQKSNRK